MVGRRGAKRVGGGEHDATALGHLHGGELADGRGLADAVHAHEHPHVGLARHQTELAIRAVVEDRDHFVAHQPDQRVGLDRALGFRPGAHGIEDPLRRREADVGEQHRLFEVVPRGVVDLVPAHAGEHTGERGAGASEPVAQARLLDDCFGRGDRDEVGNDLDLRFDGRPSVGGPGGRR